jgi:hypothetical protein
LSVGPAFALHSVLEGGFSQDASDGTQQDERDSAKGDGRGNWMAVGMPLIKSKRKER